MKRKLLTISASICVIMGTIGVFLPLWPTTPFLLLAIYLYMRSSKRGVKMILSNKMLAPYVRSYFSKGGIPTNVLIRILTLLWGTLIIGMVLCREKLFVVGILCAVGVGVTIHLMSKRCKSDTSCIQTKSKREKNKLF